MPGDHGERRSQKIAADSGALQQARTVAKLRTEGGRERLGDDEEIGPR